MKYRSVFDIIGPIMIGPSSSHTAGATRIGRAARSLLKRSPTWARVYLYGSFARTYKGHGTDVAIVGGVLGFDTFDPRIPRALEVAKHFGLDVEIIADLGPTDHPNTARIQLGNGGETFELVGVSSGGGRIEVVKLNGFSMRVASDGPVVLVFHQDRVGVIAEVASLFTEYGINIAHMEVSREMTGGKALTIVELDQVAAAPLLDRMAVLPYVECVSTMSY